MKKLLLLIVLLSSILLAADWPIFRGANQNSISEEKDWNPQSIENIIWSKNVGTGYSAVTTSKGRVYTIGNVDDKDYIYCLDEKTGGEIWKYSYDYNLESRYPGPRSTPTIYGDELYNFSREGDLYCLNAETGKLIWRKSSTTDFGLEVKHWGMCSSPVIVDDVLLMNSGGGGLAVNKNNGELIWKNEEGDGHAFSTPVLYENDSKAMLFNQKNVYAIDVKSGKQAWTFPWETRFGNNSADPVMINGKVLVSQGYKMGCALLDISDTEAKMVWENPDMSNHFGTSIYVNGFIYGPNGNSGRKQSNLVSIDPKTGKIIWTQKIGFNSIVFSDNKLIILKESGDLIIADITNNEYKELAKAKVLETSKDNPCWTMPVLSNGKIYCRNYVGDLVCIDVSN